MQRNKKSEGDALKQSYLWFKDCRFFISTTCSLIEQLVIPLDSRSMRRVNVYAQHFLREIIIGVHKLKGPYYYADYHNFNQVRRRLSLQTENKQVALLKYQELIRRRNAIKKKMPVHITQDAFKAKLLYHMSIDKAHNTFNRMKLASGIQKKSKSLVSYRILPLNYCKRIKSISLRKTSGLGISIAQ